MPYDEVPYWDESVKEYLSDKTGGKLDTLDVLLKETGAVIAGGSILRAISAWTSTEWTDIDIYVPKAMTSRLIEGLNGIVSLAKVAKNHYYHPIFRKNGVDGIQTFLSHVATFDVMSVEAVEPVVTNFDLTICQVWYDGDKVYATHPHHIRMKRRIFNSTMLSR
jgi:hypothetical protein